MVPKQKVKETKKPLNEDHKADIHFQFYRMIHHLEHQFGDPLPQQIRTELQEKLNTYNQDIRETEDMSSRIKP